MKNDEQNSLISFTKWLGKWVGYVFICILFVGLSIWLVFYIYDSKVDMFAVACKSDVPNQYEITERFYLVKRKRFEEKPYALFRPAYIWASEISKSTKIKDAKQQYLLSKSTHLYYFFGRSSSDGYGHRINRQTGQVDFYNGKSKASEKWEPLQNCKVISPKEFYVASGIHLRKIKLDIKL